MDKNRINRRLHYRIKPYTGYVTQAQIKRQGMIDFYHQVDVLDISEGGLSVRSTMAMLFEERVVVIMQNRFGRHYRFHGRVKFCRPMIALKPRFQIGIEFLSQPQRSQESWFLRSLEQELAA